MAVVKELRKGLADVTWNGVAIVDASRTFQVRANTSEAAIGDSELPVPGEAYSGSQPFLAATSRRVVNGPYHDGGGQSLWEVQVGYTYQSQGIRPNPVNDLDPSYRDDLTETVEIIVNVPIITEQTIEVQQPVVGAGPPEPPITQIVYSTRIVQLESTGTRYEIRVNVPRASFDNEAFNAAVRAQGVKLHVFGNQIWKFDGGRADTRDADVKQLTYWWVGEDGNDDLTAQLTPLNSQNDDPVLTIPVRPPFHKYIPIEYFETPTGQYKTRVGVIAERLIDADGWTNLPGLT